MYSNICIHVHENFDLADYQNKKTQICIGLRSYEVALGGDRERRGSEYGNKIL